jgi:hypothetical protein
MQKSEIQIGQEYVLREGKDPNVPLQRVKIIQHVRGKKWKAEWIDPNLGLVDYIESQNLVVRWKDRKAYFLDEERACRIKEDNDRRGYKEESPLGNVLYEVFDSLGEKDLSFYRGILSGHPEALDRVRKRANFDTKKNSELTYIDRFGKIYIPYVEALELAKAFCAAEPNTVLLNIESTEREWTQEASQPGNKYILPLLNEYRASWAIIRQWTGYDAAIAQKEAQIQRLERLVYDAIYALQKANLDDAANRLRRSLQKG